MKINIKQPWSLQKTQRKISTKRNQQILNKKKSNNNLKLKKIKKLKNQITNKKLSQYKLHLNKKKPRRKSLPRKKNLPLLNQPMKTKSHLSNQEPIMLKKQPNKMKA